MNPVFYLVPAFWNRNVERFFGDITHLFIKSTTSFFSFNACDEVEAAGQGFHHFFWYLVTSWGFPLIGIESQRYESIQLWLICYSFKQNLMNII